MSREQAMLRLLRVERDRLRAAEEEIAKLRALLGARRDRQVTALVKLLDRIIPGAEARGDRMARLATAVAVRFEIQPSYHPDLEVAARLHELGRVIVIRQRGTGKYEPEQTNDWTYASFTKGILEQIDGLSGAASLVGGIYENWDGTGFPHHLSKGQIPLRCRILRVLIDLQNAFDACSDLTMEETLDAFAEHCGTLYDPVVYGHARQVLLNEQESPASSRNRQTLPVSELKPGMVLAEDLYADSGIKLLARDCTITPGVLEAILRRHRFDPIPGGVIVHRREGERRAS